MILTEIRNELDGTALHTIQDFYSHSNWVNMVKAGTRNGINTDLGVRALPNVPVNSFRPCNDSPDELSGAGLTTLTTGYFVVPTTCLLEAALVVVKGGEAVVDSLACGVTNICFNYPSGKCRHGLGLTIPILDVPICNGINKDDDKSGLFVEAKELAQEATTAFVGGILDELGDDVDFLYALMGIGPTLAIVIVWQMKSSKSKRMSPALLPPLLPPTQGSSTSWCRSLTQRYWSL